MTVSAAAQHAWHSGRHYCTHCSVFTESSCQINCSPASEESASFKNLIIDKPAIDSIIEVRRGPAQSIIYPKHSLNSSGFLIIEADAQATKFTPPVSGRCQALAMCRSGNFVNVYTKPVNVYKTHRGQSLPSTTASFSRSSCSPRASKERLRNVYTNMAKCRWFSVTVTRL